MSGHLIATHAIRDEPHHERGHVAICNCGWLKAHPRAKGSRRSSRAAHEEGADR